MKWLIFMTWFSSCAHSPSFEWGKSGGYTRTDGGFHYDDIQCKHGEPYYLSISNSISYRARTLATTISWQCKTSENTDNAIRIYYMLCKYSIDPNVLNSLDNGSNNCVDQGWKKHF